MMKNKILTSMLAFGLVCSMTVPTFAAVTETQTKTERDGTPVQAAVQVTADIGSKYTVTVPKTIVLDSATKASDYTVSVTGDIAGNEVIKVAPNANTFKMTQTGKADVDATVAQTKTSFASSELNLQTPATTTGNVTAAGLTAGDWSGTFNFDISCDTATAEAHSVDAVSGSAIATE